VPPTPESPVDRRWLRVGAGDGTDPRAAGRAAAVEAVGTRDDAALLMVFCWSLLDPHAVLAGIREVAPDTPLVGCSTAAVIAPAGPGDRGVAVVAFGGSGFSVSTTISRDAAGGPRAAGAAAAACADRLAARPHQALLLFTDGLAGSTEEVVAGAYSVIGASMPMVGGASSPDTARSRTFQFHGDEVVRDAVVGAAIGSGGRFGVGIRHGWSKVGEAMIVTKSSRNEVYTLDDEPAAEAYLRRLGAPAGTFTDVAAFERFAERRPIGVRTRSGEVVRHVGSAQRLGSGWLYASGDVPEGGLIWPMEGDTGTVLQAAQDACREAVSGLDGRTPLGVIAFDCETRARFLGADGRREEVARMVDNTWPAPLAGLYTWGEIARTRGINGFHNQTLVVLAVG
jgi:hypothetical protein